MNIAKISPISYKGKIIVRKTDDLMVSKIEKASSAPLANTATQLRVIKKYMQRDEFDYSTFEIDTSSIKTVSQSYDNEYSHESRLQEITFFEPEVNGYLTISSRNFAGDAKKAWILAGKSISDTAQL